MPASVRSPNTTFWGFAFQGRRIGPLPSAVGPIAACKGALLDKAGKGFILSEATIEADVGVFATLILLVGRTAEPLSAPWIRSLRQA
jgi:hypothetical protein